MVWKQRKKADQCNDGRTQFRISKSGAASFFELSKVQGIIYSHSDKKIKRVKMGVRKKEAE